MVGGAGSLPLPPLLEAKKEVLEEEGNEEEVVKEAEGVEEIEEVNPPSVLW